MQIESDCVGSTARVAVFTRSKIKTIREIPAFFSSSRNEKAAG